MTLQLMLTSKPRRREGTPFEGKVINFGSEEEPEYIGTVSSELPWEAVFKILQGQPGMPTSAMLVFDKQDALDVLSYTQTLPEK